MDSNDFLQMDIYSQKSSLEMLSIKFSYLAWFNIVSSNGQLKIMDSSVWYEHFLEPWQELLIPD